MKRYEIWADPLDSLARRTNCQGGESEGYCFTTRQVPLKPTPGWYDYMGSPEGELVGVVEVDDDVEFRHFFPEDPCYELMNEICREFLAKRAKATS
jgi:hypothetical protein